MTPLAVRSASEVAEIVRDHSLVLLEDVVEQIATGTPKNAEQRPNPNQTRENHLLLLRQVDARLPAFHRARTSGRPPDHASLLLSISPAHVLQKIPGIKLVGALVCPVVATAERQRARREKGRVAEGPAALLDAIFATLPEGAGASHDVPKLVRQRRRDRAKQRLQDALDARGDVPISEPVRLEVQLLAERWARKGFDAAFPDADEFEVRCVEEGEASRAEAAGDETGRWQAAERAHRRAIVQAYGSIEIRGLQLSERVHQELETAYVPLSVEGPAEPPPPHATPKKAGAKAPKGKGASKSAGEGARGLDEAAIAALIREVNRPRLRIEQALARHARMLLIGAPGSGKSTVVAYLATRAAKGELGSEFEPGYNPIPFVLPARSVHEPLATVESLARAVGDNAGLLERALHEGRALLLVDGLDEAQEVVIGQLIPALERHLALHPENRLLTTSRPSGAPEEAESLQGLTRVRLLPMTATEVGTFIDRWCLAAELSLKKASDEAKATAKEAAEDLKARVRRSGAIEKLAQTPLLCSVICIAHRFLGHGIPERRTALYDVITNVLLYEWDRAKFPAGSTIGKLDAQAKRALLGHLARSMHEGRVAELPEAALLRHFAERLPNLGHGAREAKSLIAEIRDRNGVLVERAPGVFAFSHLTFQEYLAAVEIVGAGDYDMLLANRGDPWWHEVIALAAGLPGADAARLVGQLLSADGDTIGAGTMLAAQCAETAVMLPEAQRRVIEERIRQLIPPTSKEAQHRLEQLGDVAGPILLRELERADVDGKALILDMFGLIGYGPAAGAVSRYLSDSRRTTSAFEKLMPPYANMELSLAAAVVAVAIAHRWEYTLPVILAAAPDAAPGALRFFSTLRRRRDELGQIARLFYQQYESAHLNKGAASSATPRKRAARSG
ncbi:MAG TPA: NACHT domain-containing protein [Polyangiaceae bacterium]|nr:NACHT domain-containing protein [Polyangiaceae bacterium]